MQFVSIEGVYFNSILTSTDVIVCIMQIYLRLFNSERLFIILIYIFIIVMTQLTILVILQVHMYT